MSQGQAAPAAPPAGAFVLQPGVSYYQVLNPSPILAAGGLAQYEMIGPFLDLGSATQAAKPGALITVTLVLYKQHPPAAAPATLIRK